jgi:hypothetical protein
MRIYSKILWLALAACFLFVSCKKDKTDSGASKMNLKTFCKADMDKFCKDVEPGGGRKLKCLDQHKSELSKECIDHLNAVREFKKKQKKKISS